MKFSFISKTHFRGGSIQDGPLEIPSNHNSNFDICSYPTSTLLRFPIFSIFNSHFILLFTYNRPKKKFPKFNSHSATPLFFPYFATFPSSLFREPLSLLRPPWLFFFSPNQFSSSSNSRNGIIIAF